MFDLEEIVVENHFRTVLMEDGVEDLDGRVKTLMKMFHSRKKTRAVEGDGFIRLLDSQVWNSAVSKRKNRLSVAEKKTLSENSAVLKQDLIVWRGITIEHLREFREQPTLCFGGHRWINASLNRKAAHYHMREKSKKHDIPGGLLKLHLKAGTPMISVTEHADEVAGLNPDLDIEIRKRLCKVMFWEKELLLPPGIHFEFKSRRRIGHGENRYQQATLQQI